MSVLHSLKGFIVGGEEVRNARAQAEALKAKDGNLSHRNARRLRDAQQITRRHSLKLLATGVGLGGVITGATFLGSRLVSHSTDQSVDALHEKLSNHGQFVLDVGDGKQLIICLKQLHGGSSFNQKLATEPQPLALFKSLRQHQDNILNACHDVLTTFGSDRTRFIVEGLQGTSDHWAKGNEEFYRSIAKIEGHVQAHPNELDSYLTHFLTSIRTDPMSHNSYALLMNGTNAGIRLAADCYQKGRQNIVIGADEPDRLTSASVFDQRLKNLLRMDDVRDEDLQAFIGWAGTFQEQENIDRHQYIQRLIETHVPPDGVGVVVLGANHFACGEVLGKKTQAPLEDNLQKIPDTRVTVMDMHGLHTLLERVLDAGPRGLVITNENLTVDTLRHAWRILKQQEQNR